MNPFRPALQPVPEHIGAPQPVVFFFPDYRATNHYQELFYESARRTCDVRPGTLDEALTWQANAPAGGRSIFHLHWTTPILASARDREGALYAKEAFLAKLRTFLGAGGSFVWTIHNVLPHDVKFKDVEIELAQELVAAASHIIVHSTTAIPQISDAFAIPPGKILVLPHGNYVGVYPQEISRAAARAHFGYDESALVFLFLGQLRPYKGLDELLAAFSALRCEHSNARLLIAGRAVHPVKPGQISRQASVFRGVQVFEGHIPDAELQRFFAAADFAVLPYRNILTSGSALLAGSFGVPCIAPSISMLSEVVEDGVDGFLYGHGRGSALLQAMRRAALLPLGKAAAMGALALAHVKRFDWGGVGTAFGKAVMDAARGPEMQSIDVFGKTVNLQGRVYLPNAGKPDSIAAVVVNYRSTDDVVRLVRSLRAARPDGLDVMIVDNGSPGESCSSIMTRFPDCTVLRARENLGFAGGNNIAIALALKHGYLWCWLVNPDLEVQPDTADKLLTAAKQSNGRAIVGPVLVYGHRPESVAFAGGHVSLDRGLEMQYPLIGRPLSEPKSTGLLPTDYVNGACLFAPARAFREVGPLPESYFLYFEETDWCQRAKRAGFQLQIVGDATALHHKRSEGAAVAAPYYLYYYLRSAVQFTREHAPRKIEETVNRLRAGFMAAWAAKIESKITFYSPVAKALMEGAIEDGLTGVTGRVDLYDVVSRCLSKTPLKGAPAKGYFDRVTDGTVYAWAWRPGESDPHTTIGIFIDGQPEAEVPAVHPRNDLRDAGIGDGTHGVTWRAPDRWRDGQKHRIDLRCPRTGMLLEGAPVEASLGLRESFSLPQDAVAPAPLPIRGAIDGITGDVLTGWALDPANVLARVGVDLVHEGRVVSRTIANIARTDLQAKGIGDGSCGFVARIPVALLRKLKIQVILRVSGTDTVICERELDTPRAPKGPGMSDGVLDHFLRWSWVHVLLSARSGETFDLTLRHLEALRSALAQRWCDKTSGSLVSIVMPVWNRAGTVVDAIRSVLEQTWTDWELLIVDDGSTDASRDVIRAELDRLCDRRIRLETLGENRGVSAARNRALSLARGEIVAYLDSDNTWDPSMLQILVNLLMENLDRDCAYAGQSVWQFIDDGGETQFSEIFALRAVPYNRSLLENRNYIDLNVFVHRRALYQRLGGFDENMTRLVDWELILRYTAGRRPLFVAAPLSNYSIGRAENQVTALFEFDENHKRIVATRERLRANARYDITSSGADSNPVDVVVMARDVQSGPNESYWRFLLASTAAVGDRLVVVSQQPISALQDLRSEMGLFDEVQFACEDGAPDAALMVRALEMCRPGADLILMSDCAILAADWRESMHRVLVSLGDHAAVTGRWVHMHDSPSAATIRHYARGQGDVDIMPARVAKAVLDFEPVSGNPAVEIGTMPLFCCCMRSELTPILRGSAATSATSEEILHFFCNALRQVGGRVYYSSELVVYDRSYLD